MSHNLLYVVRWTRRAVDEFNHLKAEAERAAQGREQSARQKPSKQEGLFKQICKTLRLLKSNPRHPGLQTHEFQSLTHPYRPHDKVFEAYAQNNTPGAYRVFWCYGPGKGEITIIAITPHP